jgi:uncharacterized protein (TIGR02246 family)
MHSDSTRNVPAPRPLAALLVLIFALMVTACLSKGSATDVTREEDALRRLSLDFAAAEASNNVDSTLTFIWEDAIMQPPNAPQIQGHDAIRALYRTVTFKSLEVGTLTIRVSASGDLAAVWGPLTVVLQGPARLITDHAKFVAVWQRRDGAWKVLENSWSSNSPMEAPQ